MGYKPWSLGYSVYKFNHIRDVIDNNFSLFPDRSLPAGYGNKLDERVVEYPWFFRQLKDPEKVILDAGSILNHPALDGLKILRDRRIYMVNIAFNHFRNKMYSYMCQDLRNLSFRDNFFDAIVCISTLEHIGMDNTLLYSSEVRYQENDLSAYLKAVEEFQRVLKRGGSVYLTVPYGQRRNFCWLQVFNKEMVDKIIDRFHPSSFHKTFFKYFDEQWNCANERDCEKCSYSDFHGGEQKWDGHFVAAESVLCLEMVK